MSGAIAAALRTKIAIELEPTTLAILLSNRFILDRESLNRFVIILKNLPV